jgi:RNA polymerase sigma-70 factor (ECF subfamily)
MQGVEDQAFIERLFRRESGRATATLIRALGDFDAAEEAVQEAFVVALESWPRNGVPDNPGAWITRVARNKAVDRLRREKVGAAKQREAQIEALRAGSDRPYDIPDDRLRLMFTCCHPALAPEARVALTLRSLGGLTTGEVARAFLVEEKTMGQRLSRAKRKIRDAGIRYEVPGPEHLPERLASVLTTLYLVFNEGYASSASDDLVREELCGEAIRLARIVVTLLPGEPDASALLALMLLQDSRRAARVDADGRLVVLEDQDRSLWNREEIDEGLAIARNLSAGAVGPYALQAAIAAEHARAASPDDTNWARIAELYAGLAAIAPGPVVQLNRAVAVAMAEGPATGLELVDDLAASGRLDRYYLLHSARADLLRRLDRTDEAADAYRRARDLTENPAERDYLQRRLDEVARTTR